MAERVIRRLAAVLVADMVGYSRLIGLDEEGTIARQQALRRELIDPRIAEFGGRIVKTIGNGLLVEFPREAFREEGVEFPENESITVHEPDAQHKHFFLLPMVSALEPSTKLRANPPAGAPDTPPSAGWHSVVPMKRLFHSVFISKKA